MIETSVIEMVAIAIDGGDMPQPVGGGYGGRSREIVLRPGGDDHRADHHRSADRRQPPQDAGNAVRDVVMGAANVIDRFAPAAPDLAPEARELVHQLPVVEQPR